jgi:hypothetical protein
MFENKYLIAVKENVPLPLQDLNIEVNIENHLCEY